MRTKIIKRILDNHSIEHHTVSRRIMALDAYTLDGILKTKRIDVTGWTLHELKTWLGY